MCTSRAGVVKKTHDLAGRGAAHEVVVNDDDALARHAHGRKLELDDEVADGSVRLHEPVATVVPLDEALGSAPEEIGEGTEERVQRCATAGEKHNAG